MSQNLVWNYFTQHRRPVAECNLCNEWYHSEQVLNLEKHLTHNHPKVIAEIRESIKHANLAKCFIFDVGDSEARCVIDNCIVNIFNGIDYLKGHLNNHDINKHTSTFRNAQSNKHKTVSQLRAVENNTSASANSQSDVYSQDTKDQKELPWDSHKNPIIWRYFVPKNSHKAKCNICNISCFNLRNTLEMHLIHRHPQVLDEIRNDIAKEIKHFNLSTYFVCDKEFFQVKCSVDNCLRSVNVFHGTEGLTLHLMKYHISIYRKISPYMPKNNTALMTQPIVKENYASTNASSRLPVTYSQNTENEKRFIWGCQRNLIWQYFKPDGKPYAKCKICRRRFKGKKLVQFEQHLLKCHTEVVDIIRIEINEEIKRFNLSPPFELNAKFNHVRCNVNNCVDPTINIFYGTEELKDHLRKHHTHIYRRISEYMARNSTDVITEPVRKEDNASTNVGDPRPDTNWRT
ncbi:uncharacterized protein LOC113004372 [Solenopsis invicta]|uniref:uncharacterized protein LOC113004372 n=1 Tax=Solenopsis invicta TaxID=13686 RepID=UPI00193CDDC9|nr:uncharacterized protein LOC113004372 [Solenopsis invicta]